MRRPWDEDEPSECVFTGNSLGFQSSNGIADMSARSKRRDGFFAVEIRTRPFLLVDDRSIYCDLITFVVLGRNRLCRFRVREFLVPARRSSLRFARCHLLDATRQTQLVCPDWRPDVNVTLKTKNERKVSRTTSSDRRARPRQDDFLLRLGAT